MSFRENSMLEEDFSSSNRQEFRPIRNLLDSIRENRERRRQARHDSEENHSAAAPHNRLQNAAHEQTRFVHAEHRLSDERRNQYRSQIYEPYLSSTGEHRASQFSKQNPFRQASRTRESRPTNPERVGLNGFPDTWIAACAGQQEGEIEIRPELPEIKEIPESVKGESAADRIAVKEHNGASFDIAEDFAPSADARLEAYLNERGKELSELDLNGSSITEKGLAVLNKAPNLTKLELNDTEANDDTLKVLGAQNLRRLKELNLHSTRVGDQGVAAISNLSLNKLNLADTVISDDCLLQLRGMKSLQILTLDYSHISNDGIKHLRDLSALKSLSLKGCPITDDCVKELAKCQQLMLLNLEDTKLSPDKVQWLQKNMPRCVIIAPDGKGALQGRQERKERPFFRLFNSGA